MLRSYSAFILDLDGSVYRGDTVIPRVPETIIQLRKTGKKILFLTNNAAHTPSDYVAKLGSMGISAVENEILTSGEATAWYIRRNFGRARIYPVGMGALNRALMEAGQVISEGASSSADIVVVSVDFMFTYEKMKIATRNIKAGAKFIATNMDPTLPVEDGFNPGAGAIASSIATASGIQPLVIGKPSRCMVDMALERLKTEPQRTVMVGDRLDTDILAGNQAGVFTVLVLSGATKEEDLRNLRDERMKPKMMISDISRLTDYL